MIKDFKERYKEEFEEGSELLWPSENEDNVTRKFYRDISHLSKNLNSNKIETSFIKQIFKIITGRGDSLSNK